MAEKKRPVEEKPWLKKFLGFPEAAEMSGRTGKVVKKDVKKDEKVNYYTKEQFDKFDMKAFIKSHFRYGSTRQGYEASDIHIILDKAKEAFTNSETLITVKAPVSVCGDLHGQYAVLMRIFTACGLPFKTRYLFLGNYVNDWDDCALEVIVLLLCCRIQFPRKMFLLRGDRELAHINRHYGLVGACCSHFYNRIEAKQVFDHINEVFAMMPLAATISGRILCVHGGLSPYLNKLEDIRRIKRPLVDVKGLARDLIWSDPDATIKGFAVNTNRRCSFLYGEDVVKLKCEQLDVDLIIRGHQSVKYGYAFFAGRSLITVSSSIFKREHVNAFIGIVQVSKILEVSFVQMKQVYVSPPPSPPRKPYEPPSDTVTPNDLNDIEFAD